MGGVGAGAFKHGGQAAYEDAYGLEEDAAPPVIHHPYMTWGGIKDLFSCREPQVLFEGPAGTGKTRAVLEYVNHLCERFPGIRVLFLRQTRDSLAESVLTTFEDEVLWPGHPAITGRARRGNRRAYDYPNSSHIALAGLDKAEKTFSTQYDIVVVFEAREVSRDSWEKLGRANRNFVLPWQQRIADTNPAGEYHWLNQMAENGELHRIVTHHHNNPVYFDHNADEWTKEGRIYVQGTLKSMTGARKANLYHGKWRSEEGAIWDVYDRGTHVLARDSDLIPDHYDWHFGSFDKGIRHPGCLQIWGVKDDAMFCEIEVYQTGWMQEKWAEVVAECNERFPLMALPCDPSEPDYIYRFNDRLGTAMGADGERIARKANNAILTGIDMVTWGLTCDAVTKQPRIYFLEDRLLYGRDPMRVDARKPASTTEEIPSYTWRIHDDGKPDKEQPNPLCADHGCDALRYAAMFLWNCDLTPIPPPPEFAVDAYGSILKHEEVLSN